MAGLVVLAVVFGGCFQSTTILQVKPDGSGTLRQRTVFTAAAIAQLRQFMPAPAGGRAPELLSEAQARAMAANIGPGVAYVSSAPIKTDTMEGRDILYAFADVTKLRITPQPPSPGGLTVRADSLGPPQSITFALEPGPNGDRVLRIRMPTLQMLPGITGGQVGGSSQSPAMIAQQMAMARQMFAGLRMLVAVEPAGHVVSTNSPYVEGNRVTLFDVDFDRVAANPQVFETLQGVRTPEEAAAVVQGVPGLKFTTAPEITIQFAP